MEKMRVLFLAIFILQIIGKVVIERVYVFKSSEHKEKIIKIYNTISKILIIYTLITIFPLFIKKTYRYFFKYICGELKKFSLKEWLIILSIEIIFLCMYLKCCFDSRRYFTDTRSESVKDVQNEGS